MQHGNSQKGRIPVLRARLAELQGSMSTTEFADKLGLSRQTVGFYLNGERIPDSETLIKICKACKVSADWLLGIEPDELGLSQKAISTIRNIKSYDDTGDMLTGLNMLLEKPQTMYIAKKIKRLADSVQSEKEYSKNYLDKNFDSETTILTSGSFMLLSDSEFSDNISAKIEELYPEASGRIAVICGKSALDAKKKSIIEEFESEIELITGYIEYLSSTIFCE